MCGIIGFYSKASPSHKQWGFMNYGLHIDTVRGSHGTGIAGVALEGDQVKYQIAKKALAGPDFLQSDAFEKFEKNYNKYNLFIGHNRASTVGGIEDKNSHPFHIGPDNCQDAKDDIVLVHNGTIREYRKYVKDGQVGISPPGFNHDVDSAHAAAAMATYGEQETLERAQGWYIFVWCNLTKKTFNIARGNNRDIAFITSKDNKDLYFGSEAGMLDFLISRHGLDVKPEFVIPGEYEWYSWNMWDKDFTNYRRTAIKKFNPPVVVTRHNGWGATTRQAANGQTTAIADSTYNLQANAEALQKMGYARQDDIYFKVLRFEPYTEKDLTRGMVWGETWDAKPITVKINGVAKFNYDNIINYEHLKDYCEGKVIRAEPEDDQGNFQITVNVDYQMLSAKLAKYKAAAEDKKPEELKQFPLEIKKAIKSCLETSNKALLPSIKVPGPNGDMIGIEEWRDFCSDGCAECSSPIPERDFKDIFWGGEMRNQPYCHEHSDIEHKARSPNTRPLSEESLEKLANGWNSGS